MLIEEPTTALNKASKRYVVDLFQKPAEEEQAGNIVFTHYNKVLDITNPVVKLVEASLLS
ncbi:MAG: hypothetical protein AB8B32_09030 [Prochlorococcus sp.]